MNDIPHVIVGGGGGGLARDTIANQTGLKHVKFHKQNIIHCGSRMTRGRSRSRPLTYM